ncbi:MAG TPA: hypothetical protein VKP30_16905 [Polyangiaceae bacterium]|nr:hypothetical protein [Polyangiaceae bacterium]
MAVPRAPSREQSERLRRIFSTVAFFASILLIVGCGYSALVYANVRQDVVLTLLGCSAMLLRKADRLSLPLAFVLSQKRLGLTLATGLRSMLRASALHKQVTARQGPILPEVPDATPASEVSPASGSRLRVPHKVERRRRVNT